MKPAYVIDSRDVQRAFPALVDGLNVAASRSYAITTVVPYPLPPLNQTETVYASITSPPEAGTPLRFARIIPSEDYRIARTGDSVRICVGLRTSGRFELIGREWDSKKHALTVGTPFDLVTDEQPIRVGIGLVLRVTRLGFPTAWPSNAAVESTIGYDPGA